VDVVESQPEMEVKVVERQVKVEVAEVVKSRFKVEGMTLPPPPLTLLLI
jgi:hypothetical protein